MKPTLVEQIAAYGPSNLTSLGRCPLIMGIVNVTPDSFSDGGQFFTPEAALQQARLLRAQGADVLDLGAESTRPGFTPVEADEEWGRLASVIPPLVDEGAVLSIDTTKASVARRALKAGAQMINDVWGLQADPAMASVVAEGGAVVAVMHNRQEVTPQLDLWDEWQRFFDHSLTLAEQAGIAREKIMLDPGIGFGKTVEQNLWAIRHMRALGAYYERPILLGVSRKSLFGKLLGREVGARLPATLATHLYGAAEGACMVRVHDVQAHKDALTMAALLAGRDEGAACAMVGETA
ncbi:dihydropteroate synthase [Bombella sp. ESL0385]|uniref:dihydropteroate synthase n=1 Tax=Bombella sp. ESL0385 TaxID=2676446 RepID=UPI0012D8A8C8|nr:dihydropteroate synthase [Bombella sp. ESL0385]MUG89498.1 dihydropteroate synthase [Bombella sp. ESL0385]